jgi:hypothetical protein
MRKARTRAIGVLTAPCGQARHASHGSVRHSKNSQHIAQNLPDGSIVSFVPIGQIVYCHVFLILGVDSAYRVTLRIDIQYSSSILLNGQIGVLAEMLKHHNGICL